MVLLEAAKWTASPCTRAQERFAARRWDQSWERAAKVGLSAYIGNLRNPIHFKHQPSQRTQTVCGVALEGLTLTLTLSNRLRGEAVIAVRETDGWWGLSTCSCCCGTRVGTALICLGLGLPNGSMLSFAVLQSQALYYTY